MFSGPQIRDLYSQKIKSAVIFYILNNSRYIHFTEMTKQKRLFSIKYLDL